jgi:hypothetical protein
MRRALICSLLVGVWFCTSGSSLPASAQVPSVPVIVASVNLTNQTAAINETTLLTPTKDTTYRLSAYITVASGDSGAWFLTVGWTDPYGFRGVVTSCPIEQSGTGNCNLSADPQTLGATVRDIAGTPLTYSTANIPGTSGPYDLYLVVERLP